ncbi:MAG: hypothetical protein K1X44_06270 [Alphaproteobacteria bacterium]|nr:hypothetical protein [Alphaproteobacteria bacterium]
MKIFDSLKQIKFKKNRPTSIQITYLVQKSKPLNLKSFSAHQDLEVSKINHIPISYYRFLYNTIGAPWLWYERRLISDQELSNYIHHPDIHIHILYKQKIPIGYSEINLKNKKRIDFVYFGLMPWILGQGIGSWFLDWNLNYIWFFNPDEILINTCTLDHPKALPNYLNVGFKKINIVEKNINLSKIKKFINQTNYQFTNPTPLSIKNKNV